jgi:hypothetical protein
MTWPDGYTAQAVADEVHAPGLVHRARRHERDAFVVRTATLATLAHRQIGLAIQPVHALVVDARVAAPQQVVHAPVAEASALVRNGFNVLAQGLVLRAHRRRVAVRISTQPHEAAGTSLAHPMLVHQTLDRLPPHPWG